MFQAWPRTAADYDLFAVDINRFQKRCQKLSAALEFSYVALFHPPRCCGMYGIGLRAAYVQVRRFASHAWVVIGNLLHDTRPGYRPTQCPLAMHSLVCAYQSLCREPTKRTHSPEHGDLLYGHVRCARDSEHVVGTEPAKHPCQIQQQVFVYPRWPQQQPHQT